MIAILFDVIGMSEEKFAEVHARLGAAGQAAPDGRVDHIGYLVGDQVKVVDVWESAEKFEAFGAVLIPILHELGIDPGEPQISPVALHQVG